MIFLICVNRLLVLLIRLPINSRLLVVTVWGSPKLYGIPIVKKNWDGKHKFLLLLLQKAPQDLDPATISLNSFE